MRQKEDQFPLLHLPQIHIIQRVPVHQTKASKETLMQWPKAKEKATGRLDFACAAGLRAITHTTAPLQEILHTKPCANDVEAKATE